MEFKNPVSCVYLEIQESIVMILRTSFGRYLDSQVTVNQKTVLLTNLYNIVFFLYKQMKIYL